MHFGACMIFVYFFVVVGFLGIFVLQLSMEPKLLEENFAALIKDVHDARPKRPGSFITRCLLVSPPSSEKLKVDHTLYIGVKDNAEEDEDNEEFEARSSG